MIAFAPSCHVLSVQSDDLVNEPWPALRKADAESFGLPRAWGVFFFTSRNKEKEVCLR